MRVGPEGAETPAVDQSPVNQRLASRGEDAGTVVLGAWLVVALFSDGWAHHNVPELEGFFTPWHGALYAGLAVSAAWMVWLGRSGGLRWYRDLPVGYGWGVVGLGVFTAGGLADMAWHVAFGVEAGIDALLSPTHLVLLTGGMLILTSALRSRWAVSDTSSAVSQAALSLATALVAFFLLYVSEFTATSPTVPFERLPEGHPRHTEAELPATHGLAAFLITTAVFVAPLLLVWRRGRSPQGVVVAVVATVSLLSAVVIDFERTAVLGAVGAVIGAVGAELMVGRLDRRQWARPLLREPVLAATVTAAVWSGHLASLAMSTGLAWPPELWSGVVVLSVMAASALAGLSRPADAAHL
jgi:hypothetical protein